MTGSWEGKEIEKAAALVRGEVEEGKQSCC